MITHKFGLDYSISFKKVDPDDSEILKEFECEEPAIRNFARYRTLNTQKDVTYIFVDNENKAVICFCSLSCTGISTTEYTPKGDMYHSTIPAIEIDFFAVDKRYRSIPFDENSSQYETLSKALFLYMLEHIRKITENVIGATHICLYAVPDALNFYKRCDFVEFEKYMNRDEKAFVKDCIPMFYVI